MPTVHKTRHGVCSLFGLRIPCPLSQSRPSLPTNRMLILDFPPFYQRRRSERLKRVVPEELLPQLILQICNRKWLLSDSSRFFERTWEVEFRA